MRNRINKHSTLVLMLGIIISLLLFNVSKTCADKYIVNNYLLNIEDDSYVFNDISIHWARHSIEKLSYMEVLKGFPNGDIMPDKTITRAEFVTMIVRAVDIPITDYYPKYYEDIDASSWSYYHVSTAKKNGIIDVFNDARFEPNKIITREEMAVIASEVVNTFSSKQEIIDFKDINSSYKYYNEILIVANLGIIKGMPDGSFRPNGNASRAEAATIIHRVLNINSSEFEVNNDFLLEVGINYEQSLINDSNNENSKLISVLQLSYGKERKHNHARVEFLKSEDENHITRVYSNMKADIISKTIYLGEIELEYNLQIYNNENIVCEYIVNKRLYLAKKNNNWKVYNVELQFAQIYSTDTTIDNSKINLAWQYIYSNTPDMSSEAKIKGLNVISPTWFRLSNEAGDISSSARESYTKWAHEKGYKVWALISNDFDKQLTSEFLNNPSSVEHAVDQLMKYAVEYKLDGINVDFENMYTEDRSLFTNFVGKLYEKAKLNNIIISVDVTVIAQGSNWSSCYNRKELSQVSDYIMLMAYDQHWGGSPISGSVAQITWVENKLKQVLNEVPHNKLVLGLPFYTRLWKETYDNGSTQVTVSSKAISMEKAEAEIKNNNGIKIWDEESGQYFITYSKGDDTYKIWLENEDSISVKVNLVDKYNLAGVASWRLGFEKPEIWEVINEGLYNN